MSYDRSLDKLSEKLNGRLLVQEKHGFQKGAQCAPLAVGAKKMPGLDRVNKRKGKWNKIGKSFRRMQPANMIVATSSTELREK